MIIVAKKKNLHLYLTDSHSTNPFFRKIISRCKGSEVKKHCKRFVLGKKLTQDQKSLIGTNPSHFFSPREQGMAQW